MSRIENATSSRRALLLPGACILILFLATDGRAQEQGAGHTVLFEDADGEVVRILPRFGRRAFLGVSTVDLTPELREHLGAPRESGVLVSAVTEGGPAERAGLEVGDVVTRLGDDAVDSVLSLVQAISGHAMGDSAVLEAWRDGRSVELEVVFDQHEVPSFDVGPLVFRLRGDGPGRLLTIGPGEFREIPIDPERLQRLGRELGERIASQDRQERRLLLRTDRDALEERIRELEGRLRELEGELRTLLGANEEEE